MKISRHTKSSKGFSLIELMTAISITTLIIIALVSMTSVSLDVWRKSRDSVRGSRLGSTAIDTISQDLVSLTVRGGSPNEGLSAKAEPHLSSAMGGPSNMKIPNAAQLVFFASPTDRYDGKPNAGAGDVCGISYRLVYRDQILNKEPGGSGGFPVFSLYRHLVNPEDVFKSDALASEDLIADWKTFAQQDIDSANFLVENIIEMSLVFEVEYMPKNAKEKAIKNVVVMANSSGGADGYSGFSITGTGIKALKGGKSEDQDLSGGRAIALTVNFSVVSDSGMEIVERMRKGKMGEYPGGQAEFFKKHTVSFSRRIVLPRP